MEATGGVGGVRRRVDHARGIVARAVRLAHRARPPLARRIDHRHEVGHRRRGWRRGWRSRRGRRRRHDGWLRKPGCRCDDRLRVRGRRTHACEAHECAAGGSRGSVVSVSSLHRRVAHAVGTQRWWLTPIAARARQRSRTCRGRYGLGENYGLRQCRLPHHRACGGQEERRRTSRHRLRLDRVLDASCCLLYLSLRLPLCVRA